MWGVPVISIIDDDDSVREATKGLVRSLGYGVATFASAEGFLQSNEINDTECVISDVQMPGLSGVELQSQLIADGNRTPIILKLRAGGLKSSRALAAALTARNIPTPSRRGSWSAQQVRRVLERIARLDEDAASSRKT